MKDGAKNFEIDKANPDLLQIVDALGLYEDHLISFLDTGVKIHPQVLPDLLALNEKAQDAGFDMRIASGFRNFNRQLLIWNNKALGIRPVLNAAGESIDLQQLSDDEKVFAILRWSALPGASRHHWGTDIDIYDASNMTSDYQLQLTVEETIGDGPCAKFHSWLTEELRINSQRFYRPYIEGIGSVSPEPWHLSYAPLAQIFAKHLTENSLREKIISTNILLKESILKNFNEIFERYIKPYQ